MLQACHCGSADVDGEREAAVRIALFSSVLLPVFPFQE
jgi:hypothetical protein